MILSTPGLRDRAYVFFGEERNMTAILSRGFPPSLETLLTYEPHQYWKQEINILVENQGGRSIVYIVEMHQRHAVVHKK